MLVFSYVSIESASVVKRVALSKGHSDFPSRSLLVNDFDATMSILTHYFCSLEILSALVRITTACQSLMIPCLMGRTQKWVEASES